MRKVALIVVAIGMTFATDAFCQSEHSGKARENSNIQSEHDKSRGRGHPHGGPPGQIQKTTGYNPASGKYHPHGRPPGQVQKETGYNPASGQNHPHGGPPGQTNGNSFVQDSPTTAKSSIELKRNLRKGTKREGTKREELRTPKSNKQKKRNKNKR